MCTHTSKHIHDASDTHTCKDLTLGTLMSYLCSAKGKKDGPADFPTATQLIQSITPVGVNLGSTPQLRQTTSPGERNKTTMAIPYSLILRQVQPGKPKQGNKTFPMAQYAQLLDLAAMAEHMTSHGSKYDKGDIMAMATQMTSCIREQLLLGNKVALGDLGAFAVSLESKSAPNAESFHIGLIKKVKVKWEPSAKFTDLLNEAQFQYVGTRKSQNEARKAERELLNSMATIQPGQEPEDGGDDNTGGEDDGNLGE